MAQLFPFQGYRYNPDKVGQIGDVVSQPYDKISTEMWQDYLKRHPCNIVRVIKNQNYEQAASYLKGWIQDDVLSQDDSPAFYPYEQRFELEGRTVSRLGFIGLVSLDDSEFAVKGHERIMNDPLEDRLSLIRSTESNEGLIFMLYSDSELQVDQLLDEFRTKAEPVITVRDEYGVTNRVWKLSAPDVQNQIIDTLKHKTLYIADGHHRFQTSLLYSQECEKKGWKSGTVEGFDKRMIGLFNMEAPGLSILPTHRGILNLQDFNLNDFLSSMEPFFELERLAGLQELDFALRDEGTRIGLVTNQGEFWLLQPRGRAANDPAFMPGITGSARQLSVNVLHGGILQPLLGIGPKELASQDHVHYFRSQDRLIDSLRDGHHQLAFILNPTQLTQVREISERGEKMPPKSTDFYPKLLTGLVLMKMRIDKTRARQEQEL